MNSMTQLNQPRVFQDQFGRQKRKLRISVTDRCNFKCVYCMPEHPEWMNKQSLLSFEELYAFCEFMVQQGIEQIRITGGEPLMRQGVVHFIAQLQALRKIGLKRISMTTNGHYLAAYAAQLKHAGLDGLNISLDSLNPVQFEALTQKQLQPVLDGIAAAKQSGLNIKINTVLIKGMNDDQILPIVKWAHSAQFEPRFIEFMPLDGDQNWSASSVVTEQEILNVLATEFAVQIQQGQGASPARSYHIDGKPVGIISTITNAFCGECDRLRLNAQGELFNCLFAQTGLRLKAEIQYLAQYITQHDAPAKYLSQFDLHEKLSAYIWQKKSGYQAIQAEIHTKKTQSYIQQWHGRKISMHMIGG